MMQTLRQLIPSLPSNLNAEDLRRYRLLRWVLLFSIAAVVFYLVFSLLVNWNPANQIASNLVLLAAFGGLLALLRRASLPLTAVLTCTVMWLGITFINFGNNGLLNPFFAAYLIVVMLAGLLIGLRAAVGFAGASLVIGAMQINHYEAVTISPEEAWIAYALMLCTVTGLVYFVNRGVRQALDSAERLNRRWQESEARYRQLMDAMPVSITLGSLDEKALIYANTTALKLFEINSIHEINDQHFESIFTAAAYQHLSERVKAYRNGEMLPPTEYQINNGRQIDLVARSIIVDYEGKRSLLSIMEDITERKALDTRYRQILDVSPIAIVVNDAKRIAYVNQAGATTFGAASPEELIGIRPHTLWPDTNEKTMEAMVQQGREAGGIPRMEVEGLRADGQPFPVEFASIATEFDGEPMMLSVFQDITARKQAEETKIRAEVLRLELEKEKSLAKLRESFIAMMSHEFRTPLTVILSSKELIQRYYDRMDAAKRESHFAKIDHSVQYMIEMVDDMLTLSKMNAGLIQFKPTTQRLDSLVEDVIQSTFSKYMDPPNIDFQSAGEWQPYLIDEELIATSIRKLLLNAVYYAPQGSPIIVRLAQDAGDAVLTVNDRGNVIPPEDLKHLFNPFYREKEIEQLQNSGLGLALVKDSVEIHGGSITCTSTTEDGTTFTIRLPLLPIE